MVHLYYSISPARSGRILGFAKNLEIMENLETMEIKQYACDIIKQISAFCNI